MPDELIRLLTQLPIVAVFIWFVDRIKTEFLSYLREERAARQAEQAAERAARREEVQMLAERLEGKLDTALGNHRRRDDLK